MTPLGVYVDQKSLVFPGLTKYFCPLAIETLGPICVKGFQFPSKLGSRLSATSGVYLFINQTFLSATYIHNDH